MDKQLSYAEFSERSMRRFAELYREDPAWVRTWWAMAVKVRDRTCHPHLYKPSSTVNTVTPP